MCYLIIDLNLICFYLIWSFIVSDVIRGWDKLKRKSRGNLYVKMSDYKFY